MFMVVIYILVLGQFATEIYLPSLPSMAIAFHVPINAIQLTITIYVAVYVLGALIYGPLSDKLGRKSILMLCIIIGSIGSFICSLSFSIHWLYIGRMIQGLGFSGIGVIGRSVIADSSDNSQQASRLASIFSMFYTGALACAPIIGGYIQEYMYWRINFILLFAMSVAALFLCWYKFSETLRNKRHVTLLIVLRDYLEVILNKKFIMYNTISLCVLGGVLAYQTLSPYLLQVKN